MGDLINNLSRQLREEIKNLQFIIKQKIPKLLVERQEKIREISLLIAKVTFNSEFGYTYLDIDLNSVEKSITSVSVDAEDNVIINFNNKGVKFDLESLKKDTEKFNQNESDFDAQDRLLDILVGDNSEDWEPDEINSETIDQNYEDVETQISSNKGRWRVQDFSWANKRNRQGAFTPISKTADNSKILVEIAVGNEIKNKIDPDFIKKLNDLIKKYQ